MIDPNATSPRKIITSVIEGFTPRKPWPKPQQQATRSSHSIAEWIKTVGKAKSLRVDSTAWWNASIRLRARRNPASGRKPSAVIAKQPGNQDLSFPCNQIRENQLAGPSPQRVAVDPMTVAEKRVPCEGRPGQGLPSLPTAGRKSLPTRDQGTSTRASRDRLQCGRSKRQCETARDQGMDNPPSRRRR